MVPYLVPPEELNKLLPNQPSYRADQLRQWLYRQPVLRADSMTNLPLEVRHLIGERLWPFEIEAEQTADQGATESGCSVHLTAQPSRPC